MVDLRAQYEKMGGEIDSAIKEVLSSARYIKGPEVARFEDELGNHIGSKHVITCGNGTDALQIALMALNLNPGDEVITTNFTFIATAEVVSLLGLKLVLADVDPRTFNISTQSLQRAITPRTKVIIPVHLFGQCADMEAILKIANDNGLYVIEDSAQATGAIYTFPDGSRRHSGTMGTIGTTSFFPSKNLSCCGDGGALFTNDDEIAKRIRCIANHGSMVKYYHDKVGVNSRLDTIQAAILSVKLKYLEQHNKSREAVAAYYDNAFRDCEEIETPLHESYSTHIYHQYTLKVKGGKRHALKEYLAQEGIPSMIYYPVAIHMQEAYRDLGYEEDSFPTSSSLCNEVLSLPIHPEMEEEQMQYITNKVLHFFN